MDGENTIRCASPSTIVVKDEVFANERMVVSVDEHDNVTLHHDIDWDFDPDDITFNLHETPDGERRDKIDAFFKTLRQHDVANRQTFGNQLAGNPECVISMIRTGLRHSSGTFEELERFRDISSLDVGDIGGSEAAIVRARLATGPEESIKRFRSITGLNPSDFMRSNSFDLSMARATLATGPEGSIDRFMRAKDLVPGTMNVLQLARLAVADASVAASEKDTAPMPPAFSVTVNDEEYLDERFTITSDGKGNVSLGQEINWWFDPDVITFSVSSALGHEDLGDISNFLFQMKTANDENRSRFGDQLSGERRSFIDALKASVDGNTSSFKTLARYRDLSSLDSEAEKNAKVLLAVAPEGSAERYEKLRGMKLDFLPSSNAALIRAMLAAGPEGSVERFNGLGEFDTGTENSATSAMVKTLLAVGPKGSVERYRRFQNVKMGLVDKRMRAMVVALLATGPEGALDRFNKASSLVSVQEDRNTQALVRAMLAVGDAKGAKSGKDGAVALNHQMLTDISAEELLFVWILFGNPASPVSPVSPLSPATRP